MKSRTKHVSSGSLPRFDKRLSFVPLAFLSAAIVCVTLCLPSSCGNSQKELAPSSADPFCASDKRRSAPPLTVQELPKDPAMQLAWDLWKRRIDNSVKEHFNHLAPSTIGRENDRVRVVISYIVTDTRNVQDVVLEDKSECTSCNDLALKSVASLRGQDSLLQFPPGTKLKQVKLKTVLSYPAVILHGLPENAN